MAKKHAVWSGAGTKQLEQRIVAAPCWARFSRPSVKPDRAACRAIPTAVRHIQRTMPRLRQNGL
jgi:hypothetical protein